jgi:replication-associated recombination protein RarA
MERDPILSKSGFTISAINDLINYGSGDARKTLNLLENCVHILAESKTASDITGDLVKEVARQNVLLYDKQVIIITIISPHFLKSVRGSIRMPLFIIWPAC